MSVFCDLKKSERSINIKHVTQVELKGGVHVVHLTDGTAFEIEEEDFEILRSHPQYNAYLGGRDQDDIMSLSMKISVLTRELGLLKEQSEEDLNNGKQTFTEKLRETATLLVVMADEAEAALRESA